MKSSAEAPGLRVLIIDLGVLLLQDGRLRPHVEGALKCLARLESSSGQPLLMCLLSGSGGSSPPVKEAPLSALFACELQRLKDVETASERFGAQVALDACLLMIGALGPGAASPPGLSVLRFAPPGASGDFSDWSEAPLLVARKLTGSGGAAFLDALAWHLQAARGLRVEALHETARHGVYQGVLQRDHSLEGEALGELKGVKVAVPVEVELALGEDGRVRSVHLRAPGGSPEEVEAFARSLEANGQLVEGTRGSPGATHEIKTDAQGERRLVRKRFSLL